MMIMAFCWIGICYLVLFAYCKIAGSTLFLKPNCVKWWIFSDYQVTILSCKHGG
jgi:hypothetical protein